MVNNFNFQAGNQTTVDDKELKVITVTIKIKNNLPIRKDINLKTKYYFRLLNKKVALISVINKINLSTEYFEILDQDLNLEIDTNYTLVLQPTKNALELYNRNTINYETLVNIGLKDEDAKKVFAVFHDLTISSQDLESKLKEILPTAKRKFLKIIEEFVIF